MGFLLWHSAISYDTYRVHRREKIGSESPKKSCSEVDPSDFQEEYDSSNRPLLAVTDRDHTDQDPQSITVRLIELTAGMQVACVDLRKLHTLDYNPVTPRTHDDDTEFSQYAKP